MDKNKLIVFTAPSGAGKTTIVQHLLGKYPQLAFSISATTRTRRTTEIEGKDYYFMSKEAFELRIHQGAFMEWEEVYPDIFYGTLKSEVERLWKMGKQVLFDIDVQGAINLKKDNPNSCFVIFVKPPSLQTLIDRLKNRKTETEESLKKRVNKLKQELEYADQFDHCLINDDLSLALTEAENIIEGIL